MRLIDVKASQVEEPYNIVLIDRAEVERNEQAKVKYAILSHRWEREEVTFKDLLSGEWVKKYGTAKLVNSIKLAAANGMNYIWLDTCCIDKDSSSELSEAINSMYRWYAEAEVCYAFLSDLTPDTDDDVTSELKNSVWFTRGWTLQELLAPSEVEFYSSRWHCVGTRAELADLLGEITGIPVAVMAGNASPQMYSTADRMSWAADRHTERIEDRAYSLMGLFSVNMPMLYGEGEQAFIRLQEEILKNSEDYSIFAWQKSETEADQQEFHGLLADSPADFRGSRGIILYSAWRDYAPISMTNKGLHVELAVTAARTIDEITWASLPCAFPAQPGGLLGICISRLPPPSKQWARCDTSVLQLTMFEGTPQQMYFPQKHALGSVFRSHQHTVCLRWSGSIQGNCMLMPLAVLLNQHPFNNRGLVRGRNVLDKRLLSDRVIGPICMSRWTPGIEAMILFKGRHSGNCVFSFIFLLGTTPKGDIGYDIASADSTTTIAKSTIDLERERTEFNINGTALKSDFPLPNWTAVKKRFNPSPLAVPAQLSGVYDTKGARLSVVVTLNVAESSLVSNSSESVDVNINVEARSTRVMLRTKQLAREGKKTDNTSSEEV